MRLQALRPAIITRASTVTWPNTAAETVGPCPAWTISHIHRTLRKALADAVHVDRLLAATRPRGRNDHAIEAPNPSRVWTTDQLGSFLAPPVLTGCTPSTAWPPTPAHDAASSSTSAGQRVDLDAGEVTFGGSTAVVRGQRVEGTTKGGRSRVVSIDHETVAILRDHRRQQAEERLAAGSAWTDSGGLVFVGKWGEPLYPDTVTALMAKLINEHNKSAAAPPASSRTPGCMTSVTCTPPRCCWQGSRYTSSPPGSGMPIRP